VFLYSAKCLAHRLALVSLFFVDIINFILYVTSRKGKIMDNDKKAALYIKTACAASALAGACIAAVAVSFASANYSDHETYDCITQAANGTVREFTATAAPEQATEIMKQVTFSPYEGTTTSCAPSND
jgi:hypothetical protein